MRLGRGDVPGSPFESVVEPGKTSTVCLPLYTKSSRRSRSVPFLLKQSAVCCEEAAEYTDSAMYHDGDRRLLSTRSRAFMASEMFPM